MKHLLSKDEKSRTYVEQKPKRKEFIIVYEDGSKEVYDEGILITARSNGRGITCMHLNTGGNVGFYAFAMAQLSMDMLDNETKVEKLIK